ncbi:hypothetical protein [Clostridium beijerinckii]|uniref:hypothetical protein n=1 Tax=Clostridium beijerinckii TaxID=1520 RepID=UPI001494CB49|nr:hypothetical protein [Clostridium beijerinckii]NOW08038.1 uncharacterized protein YxeA [Clostridium beijerinckii]NYC05686.1 uncharacterized protein YxeA [Clostridium beijerinckii]
MKKIMITGLILALSITSSTAVFAAENTNGKVAAKSVTSVQAVKDANFVDQLVEKKATNGGITVQGTGVPTSKWTLDNGSYRYNIGSFDTNIRTNYYFTTETGEIDVSTNFKPVNSGESTDDVEVVLYKIGSFGYSSRVDSQYVSSNGGDSASFTGLSSSNNYYISFEKTYDGVYLKGSGTISE